jgi:hypothetical protein
MLLPSNSINILTGYVYGTPLYNCSPQESRFPNRKQNGLEASVAFLLAGILLSNQEIFGNEFGHGDYATLDQFFILELQNSDGTFGFQNGDCAFSAPTVAVAWR